MSVWRPRVGFVFFFTDYSRIIISEKTTVVYKHRLLKNFPRNSLFPNFYLLESLVFKVMYTYYIRNIFCSLCPPLGKIWVDNLGSEWNQQCQCEVKSSHLTFFFSALLVLSGLINNENTKMVYFLNPFLSQISLFALRVIIFIYIQDLAYPQNTKLKHQKQE